MRMRFNKWLPSVLVMAGFAFLSAPREAHALLVLVAQVNGSNVFATDGDAAFVLDGNAAWTRIADISGTVGELALANQNIGGLLVSGSVHTMTIATSVGDFNILDSSSLSVTNNSGGTVMAEVIIGATDFVGPAFEAFASGSGTWETANGSTITMNWWNDPNNAQPGDDLNNPLSVTPGTLVHTFTDTAVGPADAFATSSGSVAVFDPALFSMTLGFEFTLVDGGELLSRGQAELKPLGVVVPEPGTIVMALSALPLMGGVVGYRRWRRREQV